VLLAFLRLSTRSGIFPGLLSVDDALRVMERWLEHPQAQVAHPGERHTQILGHLLRSAGTAGNLTNNGCTSCRAGYRARGDRPQLRRDFARFEGVQWKLPAAD
jgi:hypothetical protein